MILEITSKFPIVFEDLYLEKWWFTELPGHDGNRCEIWIWFEGSFKEFRVRIEILDTVFDWVSKKQLIFLFYQIDIAESWGWRISRAMVGKWRQV